MRRSADGVTPTAQSSDEWVANRPPAKKVGADDTAAVNRELQKVTGPAHSHFPSR
jgi:hypothetical protein